MKTNTVQKYIDKDLGKMGFTLIELSIVIIIIGLLIAGITAGQTLIKQAELNAVINEVKQYQMAIVLFEEKYNALPGDMSNAYYFWGAIAGCTNEDVNIDYTGCNGNGNQYIDGWTAEGIRVWTHLSLAGLISGQYNLPVPTDHDTHIGINVPSSSFSNAGYHVAGGGLQTFVFLQIGAYRPGGDRPCTNVLTSQEAQLIDQKMDDGVPNTGSVLATGVNGYPVEGGGWADYCTDGAANYLLSTPGVICRLEWALFTN